MPQTNILGLSDFFFFTSHFFFYSYYYEFKHVHVLLIVAMDVKEFLDNVKAVTKDLKMKQKV